MCFALIVLCGCALANCKGKMSAGQTKRRRAMAPNPVTTQANKHFITAVINRFGCYFFCWIFSIGSVCSVGGLPQKKATTITATTKRTTTLPKNENKRSEIPKRSKKVRKRFENGPQMLQKRSQRRIDFGEIHLIRCSV